LGRKRITLGIGWIGRAAIVSSVLALAALALGGCSGGRHPRVVVIGMDGLEWAILRPLLDRGELPNFARFVNEGASGPLRSEAPLLSPIIWTTIATGLPPDRHDVLDFTAPDPAGGEPIVVTSLHRRTKAYWNILSERGIRTGVIGWWATWPAEIIEDGFVVSDRIGYHAFIGEHRPTRSLVYPPALTEDVLKELRDPESVTYEEARAFMRVPREEFDAAHGLDFTDPLRHFRYIYVTMDNVTRVAKRCFERERPDVLSVYYEGIDTACHTYLRFAPPDLPTTTPAERERFGGTAEAFYRYQDRLLGELLSAVGEATVLIISDHGFLTGADRPHRAHSGREAVEAPRWHRSDGVIMALGPGVQRGATIEGATIRDVAPTVLALAGVPPSQEMNGVVLSSIVPAESVPARVPSYEDAKWLGERQRVLAESTFDREIMNRLAALGYITPEGGNRAASARALSNLASYYRGQGDLDRARSTWEKALEVEPENPQVNSNLGRMLAEEGALSESLPYLERAFADDPEHVQVGYWLVRALAAHGSLRRAVEVGERVAAAHPGEISVLVNLGNVYRLDKRSAEAHRVFSDAVTRNPESAASWYNLGELELERGRREEAIRCFETVLRLSPSDPQARARLESLGVSADR
jgi:tetratricopeptide (TPR) repeat protein/predicted AlkP superfamily pyrophosphatase or phosphodiesterase